MKIFTSYFGRKAMLKKAGIVPICIALWKPKWYEGLQLLQVAPKAFMLKEDLTRQQYIDCYKRYVTDRLRVEQVVNWIEQLSGGKDAALLCYEKPGDFCHRHLLAQWMTEQSGLVVEEWEPDGEQQNPEPVKAAPPVLEEPTLF